LSFRYRAIFIGVAYVSLAHFGLRKGVILVSIMVI
jgi:hypothetical protein